MKEPNYKEADYDIDREATARPSDPTISGTFPQNVLELEWRAVYDDDTILNQFKEVNGQRVENKYKDINREKLARFDMVNPKTGKAIYALYLREGQQLIFRRRTLKKINQPDTVIFLIGYQQTFIGNNGPFKHIVINYIHPDGSIALDGARSNLELLDFEY